MVGASTTDARSAKVVIPTAVSSGASSRNRPAASSAASSRLGAMSVWSIDSETSSVIITVLRCSSRVSSTEGRASATIAAPTARTATIAAAARSSGTRPPGATAITPGSAHSDAARRRPRAHASRPAATQRQRQQRPEPARRLEGHDSLGPKRQAATPASTSRPAAIPAGQPVTSVLTCSVPMNDPSSS